MKTALYWEKSGDKVRCLLCPHYCLISEGENGLCKIRNNIGGTLVTTIFGEVTSTAIDPIEKKPLYHYLPGSMIFSAGTNGCNLACQFCQNWEISQTPDSGRHQMSSDEIIKAALNAKSFGVAYTYNEPFIWFEFVLETAKKARKAGLKNVLVTNGYINNDPLMELLPYIDAMNIDLKAFKQVFYRDICKGDVETVKSTIIKSFEKCHIELTNLLIPSQNDTEEELNAMANWVADISPDIPFHLSRYFAQYQMKSSPTSIVALEKAREILSKTVNYVYIGNANVKDGSTTKCYKCKNLLVTRTGYSISNIKIVNGKCGYCGNSIYGTF